MKKVFMKIHGYDSTNQSIMVSFSTDKSQKPLGSYRQYSFQLQNFIGTTADEIVNELMHVGKSIAETQDREEAVKQNKSLISVVKMLVGTQHELAVEDIGMLSSDNTLPNLTGVVK